MAYKVVQMVLRGMTFILMVICVLVHSENEDLSSTRHFIMSGVYGGYAAVSLGLLVEAGLFRESDKMVETLFLSLGIVMNFLCLVFALIDFLALSFKTEHMTIGVIGALALIIFVADITLLYSKIG